MNLLLDTHALLWWLADDPRLPAPWRAALATPSNRVSVSAASIIEIAIKKAIGKLEMDADLAGLAEACGFVDLPVTASHAAQLAILPWHHRDPFDRLLVAQAQTENMRLVSLDQNVRRYDVDLLAAGA